MPRDHTSIGDNSVAKSAVASGPSVSVIIPVYNDGKRLEKCLTALERQTYPQKLYEVIVVDNGSDDKLDFLLRKYKQMILVWEDRPGSYAARNKGLSVAKGEIIAFTDSDCIPSPDWIEKGVSHLLKNPNCGLLAGKIDLFFENDSHPTSVEIYEYNRAFNQKEKLKSFKHGVTANLFAYKKIFSVIGPFDHTLKSGGDVEWGLRVHIHGYDQIYADECSVLHPARRTFRQLFGKVARVEGGIYALKKKPRYSFFSVWLDVTKHCIKILGITKNFFLSPSPLSNRLQARHKIQYIMVASFVGFIKIYERIRLHMGYTARR